MATAHSQERICLPDRAGSDTQSVRLGTTGRPDAGVLKAGEASNGRYTDVQKNVLTMVTAASMLMPAIGYAATITNVTMSAIPGGGIATAPSGEIAPPPAAPLTLNNAAWSIGFKDALNYLQKTVKISATAAGHPWGGNYRIIGIADGGKTVKLQAAQ